MENRLGYVADHYSRAWNQPSPTLPRLELIPWGIDTDRFALRDQVLARRDLKLPLHRPAILCIGRVRVEDKMDWMPLLLMFQRIMRTVNPRPLLLLAGATFSDYGDALVAQAEGMGFQDDIRTFFNLPSALLPSLYAACDLLVSPTDSPSESFGLTILEAMACGRPVVAADWNGYRDLIVHGETGFRVRTDWADCLGLLDEFALLLEWDKHHLHVGQSVSVDVGQMAAYITRLLQHPELRWEMGQQGRARVEALYDWPVIIQQWELLREELAAVASTLQLQSPDRLDYLRPRYFQHFSHYATRIIDDDVPIQITSRGKDALSGKAPLLPYPIAQGFLHPDSLRGCLSAVRAAGWRRTGIPVGELLKVAQKVLGLSRDEGLMHLMWLAKYDMVALGGSEPLEETVIRGS
jgi:D-inositol-3-phosphate glycosyltransferase